MASAGKQISGNRTPFDDFAVSEVVGYIILMGIIVVGLSIIILMNMPSVNSSKSNAEFSNVEQAFTTADSRISKARFSTSISQETPFTLNDGNVIVDGSDTNSYLEIYKEDTSLANRIYHTTLGTLKCVTDQGEVAYQAGGVWETGSTGGSVMISPPDFNYNGETLTLPVMRIVGDESVATNGGSILIDVTSQQPQTIYPKLGSGTNPVEQGKDIIIRIKSDYYLAWADFINERTEATATIDSTNKIITATLKTGWPRQSGDIKNGMNTKQMETTGEYAPITTFTIHLDKRNSGYDYDMFIHPPTVTDPYLEFKVTRMLHTGKQYAVIVLEYTDLANGIHEQFSTKLMFPDATDNDIIDIDMLNEGISLNYGADEEGNGNIDNTVDPVSATWGTDELARGGDDGTFTGILDGNDVGYGDPKTLHDVTQHYFRLMAIKFPDSGPVYETYGTENGGNVNKLKFDGEASDFQLEYLSRQDLKYLYVTQGDLDVTLKSAG